MGTPLPFEIPELPTADASSLAFLLTNAPAWLFSLIVHGHMSACQLSYASDTGISVLVDYSLMKVITQNIRS